jgi:hypothetical protein
VDGVRDQRVRVARNRTPRKRWVDSERRSAEYSGEPAPEC